MPRGGDFFLVRFHLEVPEEGRTPGFILTFGGSKGDMSIIHLKNPIFVLRFVAFVYENTHEGESAFEGELTEVACAFRGVLCAIPRGGAVLAATGFNDSLFADEFHPAVDTVLRQILTGSLTVNIGCADFPPCWPIVVVEVSVTPNAVWVGVIPRPGALAVVGAVENSVDFRHVFIFGYRNIFSIDVNVPS